MITIHSVAEVVCKQFNLRPQEIRSKKAAEYLFMWFSYCYAQVTLVEIARYLGRSENNMTVAMVRARELIRKNKPYKKIPIKIIMKEIHAKLTDYIDGTEVAFDDFKKMKEGRM